MMDAESPLEGLATDQLAAEAITSILEDKTVISRSNMEHRAKFMQMLRLPVKTLHVHMLKSFEFIQNLVLAKCSWLGLAWLEEVGG